MALDCPIVDPNARLVRGLLGAVDCHVTGMVQDGYASLFVAGGALTDLLTAAMTLYVAVIGYQLILGRAPPATNKDA